MKHEPIYRHKKRGTTYRVIGRGELQNAVKGLVFTEGQTMVAYQSLEDGRVWFRLAVEFDDGRFEEISSPTLQADEMVEKQNQIEKGLLKHFRAALAAIKEG